MNKKEKIKVNFETNRSAAYNYDAEIINEEEILIYASNPMIFFKVPSVSKVDDYFNKAPYAANILLRFTCHNQNIVIEGRVTNVHTDSFSVKLIKNLYIKKD